MLTITRPISVLGIQYFTQTVRTTPANPASEDTVLGPYPKRIDANNVGWYVMMEKAGGFVEVQIA